jgi:hypothetical protein
LVLRAADLPARVDANAVAAQQRRRLQVAGLGVLVLLTHLWLAEQGLPARLGEGDADTQPRRIEVAFVRQLQQQDPPPAAAPAPPPARRLAATAPAQAASAAAALDPAPQELASAPSLPEAPLLDSSATAPTAPTVPSAPINPQLEAQAEAGVVAEMRPTEPFEWPPSTRLSYTLTGNYQGPVQGQAQVEWLRSGSRYQVHLNVSVGPSFAPLLSRRITSEGEVTEQGLVPSRYDEETKVLLRDTRRLTVWLDADRVRLPGGTEWPRPKGVQDSASQFVQMTWLFTTQPDWLVAGRTIEMPLALPRRLQVWQYDVLQAETLQTPAGPVQAVHVKPRTEGRTGGDLAAEFWVAPSLQHLPVRIVIRQDANTFVDLLIDRLPQQASPGR